MARINTTLRIECELKVHREWSHQYAPCLETLQAWLGPLHEIGHERVEDVYFDTADGCLTSAGRVFRARIGKRAVSYAYKHVVESLEHAIIRRETITRVDSRPPLQIAFLEVNNPLHQCLPVLQGVADCLRRSRPEAPRPDLRDFLPRACIAQHRTLHVAHDARAGVELVFQVSVDRVAVTFEDEAHPIRFSALEVELTRLYPGALKRLDELGSALDDVGYAHDSTSKYAHAVGVLRGTS